MDTKALAGVRGAFSVFHPDEQPLPPPEVWHAKMYEACDPDPDQDG